MHLHIFRYLLPSVLVKVAPAARFIVGHQNDWCLTTSLAVRQPLPSLEDSKYLRKPLYLSLPLSGNARRLITYKGDRAIELGRGNKGKGENLILISSNHEELQTIR